MEEHPGHIVLSIDTSIRQQLINTKTYRKQKLQESVDETNCRVCSNDQETVPHILCGCSQIAQTLYKDRHHKMLRPPYHSVLEKFEFSESQYSQPWYKQSHPVPCLENDKAKILWDILWHLEKCPRNGANKPDNIERVRQSEKGMVHNRRNCLHAGDNTSKNNV